MALTARLHDGATLDVYVAGSGPTLLLPVNPLSVDGPRADELRRWGADPSLGPNLMHGLATVARVVAFDYEGHVLAAPKPDSLTPHNVAADFHAVADAARADRFAYYGYSWLGVAGIQLAMRSSRLMALAVGGWAPLGGPYREMLEITRATLKLATEPASAPPAADSAVADQDWSTVSVTLQPDAVRQFLTFYESLQEFDERGAHSAMTCPRLCFVGGRDEIDYGERWGNVHVHMAHALERHQPELERLGWAVHLLAGLDHTQAMHASAVLPVLGPWLAALPESLVSGR